MKIINPSKEQLFNLVYNDNQDFSHIEDNYLREKLESGLIKYAPKEWKELAELSEEEEKELRRKGVK